MSKHSAWRVGLAVLATALLVGLSPDWATRAVADEPLKITVRITDGGFDPGTVEIEQGKLVELTFVWAHQAKPREEHIMVLEGYKLETEKLTGEHREATLKFVATNPGTFTFKCDSECELHDALQKGVLKVKGGSAGGSAAALTPTKVSIEPSGISAKSGSVTVAAFLLDSKGDPVPKAEVQFYLEETFVGAKGLVEVGVAKTGPTGLAKLVYKPTHSGKQNLTARFEGMGVYDASEQVVEIPSSRVVEPTIASDGAGRLHGIKDWAPLAFLTVIGSVWAAFAFILYQAWSVSRVRPGGEA